MIHEKEGWPCNRESFSEFNCQSRKLSKIERSWFLWTFPRIGWKNPEVGTIGHILVTAHISVGPSFGSIIAMTYRAINPAHGSLLRVNSPSHGIFYLSSLCLCGLGHKMIENERWVQRCDLLIKMNDSWKLTTYGWILISVVLKAREEDGMWGKGFLRKIAPLRWSYL